MGFGTNDDRRLFKVGTCVRIVDRELGLTANTFTFEYDGLSTVQTLTKPQDTALVDAAALGVADFALEGAATLNGWVSMTAAQRQDAFEVYQLGAGVERWVDRDRISPPFNSKGPNFSNAQDSDLHNAAKISKFAFQSTATTVLSPWWGTVPPGEQDGFWKSWRETP